MRGLQDKAALITGGARGIGAASARRLAEEGARVMISDVLDEEGRALAGALRAEGLAAGYVHHDVSSEAEWTAAVQAALDTWGGLHVLVNNAGIGTQPDVEHETLEGYNRLIAINQTGVWLGMKHSAPAMRRSGGGSIINVSSIFGAVGGFGASVAYHASKGAVRLMSKNAAILYATEGIRVNSVHPGFIETPMLAPYERSQDPAARTMMAAIISGTPMRRLGRAEEVAGLIAFLASEDASYCTGGEYYVDGGWTAQ